MFRAFLVLVDSLIYVVGGKDSSSQIVDMVDVYDPKERKWMPDMRVDPAGGVIKYGTVHSHFATFQHKLVFKK